MTRFPNQFNAGPGLSVGYGHVASGSTGTFAIDSAVDRIGVRYTCESTKPIAAFWLFQTAVTGTAGNVTNECELRDGNASSASIPGSTVHRTAPSVGSVGANRWCRWVFDTTYTPAVNETVWCVVRATNGAPATDFATYRALVASLKHGRGFGDTYLGYTSTNSFSSGTSVLNLTSMIEFSDGTMVGIPITAVSLTGYTSNTLYRGAEFEPMAEDFPLKAIGAIAAPAWHNVTNGIRIYRADQLPGDTPLHEWTAPNDFSLSQGAGRFVLPTPVVLRGGVGHIVVVKPASNSQRPFRLDVADWSSYPTEMAAFRKASGVGIPIQESAGTWVRQDHWAGLTLEADTFPGAGGSRLVA